MHDETKRAKPEAADGEDAARSGADPKAGEASQQEPAPEAEAEAAPEEAEDGEHPEADEDGEHPEAAEDGEHLEAGEVEASDGEAALKDQLLRALADTENVRRRARKDVEEARAYAISNFAQDLLGVADNLGRALESIPAERREHDEAVKAIADGVEMTARELDSVLARHGITKIDPLGEKFDYNLHQALFETAETDRPDGTVVQVAQIGYKIGERLLRAAMVGVAKGGAATAPCEPAAAADEATAEDGGSSAGERADGPA